MESHQHYIADQDADQAGNNPPPLPDTPDVVASNSVSVPVPAYREIQAQAQHMENVREQLRRSWANQMQELTRADLKKHSLPLAPVKRIMKADNDIRMIAHEALPLFAKACEMFIVDMTSQAWIVTEEDKRRTVQKSDIVEAVLKTNMFDFLDNIIPRDEVKERILKAKNARQGASSSTNSGTQASVPAKPGDAVYSLATGSADPGAASASYSLATSSAASVPAAPVYSLATDSAAQEQHLPIIPWPQAQQHLYQQPPFIPWPQIQQIPEQHLSFNAWPQAQQLLGQQTPEQPLISFTQAENTTDQQNLEQSSLQAEQQQDQQN
ncbi:nuclear transcription factor Y subunit C-3-like [Daucus carota subsp. sativus]|uniref:nuclear transcription factor Y subunit C-3-like n=1 Tax=Daucus carota subsp. sativus TaxID=79200 RepID=UPI003083E7D8